MLTAYDEFSGVGGISRGMAYVPWVEVTDAANHDPHAIASHTLNFPNARHYQEDVTKLDMTRMPRVDIFAGSPACPAWTDANGVTRDFDKVNAQPTLFDSDDDGDEKTKKRKENYRRSRLLMHEIIRYLRAVAERGGKPVLVGLVENVIQCRLWSEWGRWIGEFHKLGYKTRLIAFNSMHARPVRARRAPQSRDRLYLAYWHESLGRDPDFDKWLRPKAWCPTCCETVAAMQVFKKPGADMGRYRAQYVYRCPKVACRHREVVPEAMPALSVIDPTVRGVRIGDREALGMRTLEPATTDRIRNGMVRHWLPMLNGAPDQPPPAVPPLLVPVEGRPGKVAVTANESVRTLTTRNETGIATLPMPFITPLRGGGDKGRARPATEALSTVTASGNHHGLALPSTNANRSLLAWQSQLVVPYFGNADSAYPASGPVGTLTTRDRYGVARVDLDTLHDLDVDDVLFRMLTPEEVGLAMGFEAGYKLSTKVKRIMVRLYGNAVTPCVAEVLVSALVETITGQDLALAA